MGFGDLSEVIKKYKEHEIQVLRSMLDKDKQQATSPNTEIALTIQTTLKK